MLITDNARSFLITKEQANKIELALNKTTHGKEWKHIGDVLYNFSIGKSVEKLVVDAIQYNILESYT